MERESEMRDARARRRRGEEARARLALAEDAAAAAALEKDAAVDAAALGASPRAAREGQEAGHRGEPRAQARLAEAEDKLAELGRAESVHRAALARAEARARASLDEAMRLTEANEAELRDSVRETASARRRRRL